MAELDQAAGTMTIAGERLPVNAEWSFQDHVRRQTFDLEREIGEPDPAWTHTDTAGHFHALAIDLDGKPFTPTLVSRVKTVPCANGPDCEAGCFTHDGTWETTARSCPLCDEEVQPGMRGTGLCSTSIVTGMDSELRLSVAWEDAPAWLRARFTGQLASTSGEALQVNGVVDGVIRLGHMYVGEASVARSFGQPTMIRATLSGGLHRGLAMAEASRG